MPNERADRPAGRPTGRPILTSRDIARAALSLVERVGYEGLSMRRVAEDLGIQAASLYWHVQSKEHLIDLMADELLADLHLPVPSTRQGWRSAIQSLSLGYYRHLLSKRDSGRIIAGRFGVGPNFLRNIELFGGLLRRAGFSNRDAAYALFAIIVYVQGFVLHQMSPLSADSVTGASDPEVLTWIRARLLSLSPDEFPATIALATSLTKPDIERRFEFGLDLLLDGLELRLENKHARAADRAKRRMDGGG